MKHPDHHRLELLVLGAPVAHAEREEIAAHCERCAGCRLLMEEMSGFYRDLEAERARPMEDSTVPAGHSLVKRRFDLAHWEARMARPLEPIGMEGSPIDRLRRAIIRRPLTAAGATFAIAAVAVTALLLSTGDSPDPAPAYAGLNEMTGRFEVHNGRNELLWSRVVVGVDTELELQNITGAPRFVLSDLDRDGRREIVTTLAFLGVPEVPQAGLHIFGGDGTFRDITFERRISHRGVPYEIPARIEGGSRVLIDSTDPSRPEIFVTAKNDRSPNAVVRMTADGRVIGEYWHHGQFRAMYLRDIDGDGKPELLLCGTNDVDDHLGLARPMLAVLDPRRITGVTESSASPGYGHARSDAELRYIRFPLTSVNAASHRTPGVNRINVQNDHIIALWSFGHLDGLHYDLEFVLSAAFEPLRVISTTQTTELFDREAAAGRIPGRLTEAYLRELVSQVQFWDGSGWSDRPVSAGAFSTPPGVD